MQHLKAVISWLCTRSYAQHVTHRQSTWDMGWVRGYQAYPNTHTATPCSVCTHRAPPESDLTHTHTTLMERPKSYPVYVWPHPALAQWLAFPFCVQVSEAKLVYVHDLACTIHCLCSRSDKGILIQETTCLAKNLKQVKMDIEDLVSSNISWLIPSFRSSGWIRLTQMAENIEHSVYHMVNLIILFIV